MTIDPGTSTLASQYLTELGFAVALVACLWRRQWGYAVFAALALAESHANLRYPFHAWVRDALLGYPPVDAEKHSLQFTLLCFVLIGGLAILLLFTPRLLRATQGRRLTIVGAAIVLAVLSVELISPHPLDAAIYHFEGPFTRAAIAYFIGAVAIACGALLVPARKQPTEAFGAPQGVASGEA